MKANENTRAVQRGIGWDGREDWSGRQWISVKGLREEEKDRGKQKG